MEAARILEFAPIRQDKSPLFTAGDDYDLVQRTIRFIGESWRLQPSIERIASAVGSTPGELHRVFARWGGITPKGFLQALTLDHARKMLSDSVSVLDTALEVGLSGPGRLHDLFVAHDAMSPGAFKARGAGLVMHYGWHASPFGKALLIATERGLAGLAFADAGDEDAAFADMAKRWPAARYIEDPAVTAPYAAQIFDPGKWSEGRPVRIVFIGSDFEVKVWETLLKIPLGRATTYGDIAGHIGKASAARAVGSAVGRNPISFVVPCHRVIGRSGDLCGYHWGLTRKRAIIGWETGLAQQQG
jgi:AraC family transcriptional regulator of adaptative response/methylated-DNA-[protein]-cysteine methyltransferase